MGSSKWQLCRGHIIFRFFAALLVMNCKIVASLAEALVTHCLASTSEDHLAITCMFPEDIHATEKSFCVYHFQETQTDTVVLCNWVDGKPACRTKEGFNTPENVTSHFITKTSEKIRGEFGCDTLHTHTRVRRCVPSPIPGSTSKNDTPASLGPNQPVTPSTGNRDESNSLESPKDRLSTWWLTWLLLSLVILETASLIAIWYFRRFRHKKAEKHEQKSRVECKDDCRQGLDKNPEMSPLNGPLSPKANGFPLSSPVGVRRTEGAASPTMSNHLVTCRHDVSYQLVTCRDDVAISCIKRTQDDTAQTPQVALSGEFAAL